jgi:hypothetical protein
MKHHSDLLCKVRAFLTGEAVPFPTIHEFKKWPDSAIDRLITHLIIASRNDEAWVRVPTQDLRVALNYIVVHCLRDELKVLGTGTRRGEDSH